VLLSLLQFIVQSVCTACAAFLECVKYEATNVLIKLAIAALTALIRAMSDVMLTLPVCASTLFECFTIVLQAPTLIVKTAKPTTVTEAPSPTPTLPEVCVYALLI
jgi:hypothetical protein